MTKLEKLEFEAISYAQIPKLPEELNSETPLWVYAIARAVTNLNEETYVIVRNDIVRHSVIKSFGNGGIMKVLTIHPYEFVERKMIPPIEDVKSLREFIVKTYCVQKSQVSSLPKDKLLNLLYAYAVKRQIAVLKERRNEINKN